MTNTYVPLATITLTSTDSEIVFSSIPATYRDLVLVINGTLTSGEGDLTAILNGDTGANYSRVFMGGGDNAFSQSFSGETSLRFGYFANSRHMSVTQFMDYSATDKHKTVLNRSNNAAITTFAWASRWANTAAITSIAIDTTSAGVFAIGSTFSLYGIAS